MNENIKQLRELIEHEVRLPSTQLEAFICLDLLESELWRAKEDAAELRKAGSAASANLHKRIFTLEAAISRVLADSESGKGWGPDVTMVGVLRDALNGGEHAG